MPGNNHGNKEFNAILREIQRLGFRVERGKNVFKIYPPESLGGRMYVTHGTKKSIKAIVNEFRKLYGIDLKPRKA